ncbi:DUF6197 family protein [Streptomyces filamentosus]|uniref:Uncharacterized protein n=2 Tax=Streptomyces filamentosus TaxID=67294 RepID=A0A919B9H6_STRFL|nr:hypothetical protein [Streptomyces filamentosus]GHF76963.1 hypothetical protein GCM10017667_00260 [Streptomyces filamentosus]
MAASTAVRPADLTVDAATLIRDIEQYLATQAPRTAHPLVTKTTDQLVAEALQQSSVETTTAAPELTAPARWWRIIPDWALAITPARRLHGAGRPITVTQHLQLTALVIEQYGHHRGGLRSLSGRRCILGAQAVLYRLGYGDEATAIAAGQQMQNVLRRRGINEPYHRWNDRPERCTGDALQLIREAIDGIE